MIRLHTEYIFTKLNGRAVKNGIWLYLMHFFNMVIPLFTLPYITRVLGANGYGTFSIAFNIIGYFQVIVEYGFGYSGARKVALNSSPDVLNKIFTHFIFSRGLLFLLCTVAGSSYLMVWAADRYEKACLAVLMLIPFSCIFQQNWLFQGLQKMKYISIVGVTSRLISLIGIFLFVKSQQDVILYALFYSLTSVCIGVFGTIIATTKFGLRFRWDGIGAVWQEIKEGWYIFTTAFSSKVFGAFGITILGIFATIEEVGIFSAIQKIPLILMLMWSPISMILYPVASQKMNQSFIAGKNKILRYRKFALLVFFIICVIIATFAYYIIRVFLGAEYATTYYLIFPLLIWLLIGISNNFLGIQILLGGGYDKQYYRSFQISVIANIVGALFFIHFWGALGAAIAPAVAEIVLAICLKGEISKIEKECRSVAELHVR